MREAPESDERRSRESDERSESYFLSNTRTHGVVEGDKSAVRA